MKIQVAFFDKREFCGFFYYNICQFSTKIAIFGGVFWKINNIFVLLHHKTK